MTKAPAPVGPTFQKLLLLPMQLAAICVMTCTLNAQTFATLHNFSGTSTPFSPNSDGARPFAPLVVSGNTLYGTARYGGAEGKGTLFAINTEGGGFTNLHSLTSSNGAQPAADLVLLSGTLYGAAQIGGNSGSPGSGTLFALKTDGTDFTNLHFFTPTFTASYTNTDGAGPASTLALAGGTLYGTTVEGGSSGSGTIFAIKVDGTSFTNLHTFVPATDGYQPVAPLIISGDTLYGTTLFGGSAGNGTIFAMKTNGTGFTVLHTFTPVSGNPQTNSDGEGPGGLILSGTNLFGTAQIGGRFGAGTVFKLNLDGTAFETLYDFSTLLNNTNNDGAEPGKGLIMSGNTLFGVAGFGGSFGNGTVFSMKTDGTGFTTLHDFAGPYGHGSFVTNTDGSLPSGLVLLNSTLYGTTQFGGNSANGTIFRISLSVSTPKLTISPHPSFVTLTWSTNAMGFALQSATNLVSPLWTNNLPAPVVVNGVNVVTNSISDTQRYYRLNH